MRQAIADIDDTIRQVRTTIFELGLDNTSRGPRASVLALVEELTPVVGFEVSTSIDGPIDAALSDEIVEHLLATLREALTNIGRHAQASRASVMLSVDSEMCRLQILDNGHRHQSRGRIRLGATDSSTCGDGQRSCTEPLRSRLQIGWDPPDLAGADSSVIFKEKRQDKEQTYKPLVR